MNEEVCGIAVLGNFSITCTWSIIAVLHNYEALHY